MKKSFILILTAAFLGGCSGNAELKGGEVRSDEPAITGIGGIFFESDNPVETMKWYERTMGLKTDPYGAVFEFRNGINNDEQNYLRWSTHQPSDSLFQPSSKPFMINYRVHNIEGLIARMQANGVEPLDTLAAYPYGKFIHFMDPNGIKIELWEPVDSVLTAMGGVTNK